MRERGELEEKETPTLPTRFLPPLPFILLPHAQCTSVYFLQNIRQEGYGRKYDGAGGKEEGWMCGVVDCQYPYILGERLVEQGRIEE